MKIVYASSGADLKLIKEYGFDTVLGDFSDSELDSMTDIGLKCIAHSFKEHDNIASYYLYDEPDVQKISIEDQEKKISEFRSLTNKPLCIALIEEVYRQCSDKYDFYMMDIYYSKKLSKLKNYLNIAISSHFIKVLYKGKKILPIMGLYDDAYPFVYDKEILPFARKFRSYFDTDDQAIFIWKGDGILNGAGYNGVVNRPEYIEWCKELNSTTDKSWWITRKILYGIAWSVIKINPYLGKYKIVIG